MSWFFEWYKCPKSTNEKRQYYACDDEPEIKIRARRNPRHLPDIWDDVCRRDVDNRNWKRFRRTQYKIIDAQEAQKMNQIVPLEIMKRMVELDKLASAAKKTESNTYIIIMSERFYNEFKQEEEQNDRMEIQSRRSVKPVQW